MISVLNLFTLSECMETMAEYAQGYEKLGKRNIIFCEDRLTLIAERALLNKMGGTFFSSVTTFARYLKTDEKLLSKQGSIMAIGNIMANLQKENKLKCFTSLAGIKNNATCIYETIAQLAASDVTPETLSMSLEVLTQDMLKDKVSDLKEIYSCYLEFLADRGYIDESKYLALLPDYIKNDKKMIGANVFFLCFPSFTKQAAEAITAASQTAENTIGIFCSGNEEIYTNKAYDIFVRSTQEIGKIHTRNIGYKLDGEAELLRSRLFDPEKLTLDRVKTDNIKIYEADDKNDEAEYIAATIRKIMEENPQMRYRDISVLVSDVSSYSLALKKSFEEFSIPYFIDEKKSLGKHPLSKFLIGCLTVIREGYSTASVHSLTQNVFFGESDEYRNYLLKFANFRGGAKKEIKGKDVAEQYNQENLKKCREKLLLATSSIPKHGKGSKYCKVIRKIILDFKVEEKLENISDQIVDVAYKSYLGQISGALDVVLNEAEELLGNIDMTVAEFESVLSDGLTSKEISLIPMKTDAVFIGDIVDSRIEKTKYLFAAGMTDSVPRNTDDTALMSDNELARLADVKTLIEPTVADVNLRSRENFSLNLCTFEDKLYLSYPLSADGSEPSLSEVFRYIDGMFSGELGLSIKRNKKIPDEDFKYICSAPAPAIRQLLLKKYEYEKLNEDVRSEFSSLYSALDELSIKYKDDYIKEEGGQVFINCGEQLFFRNGQISPTMLESYFKCPFYNFSSRGLKLRERDEAVVMATDSGNFIHELLELTAKKLKDFNNIEEAKKFAEETGKELLKKPLYAAQMDTATGKYFTESLLEEGKNVTGAVYNQLKASTFNVKNTEKVINTDMIFGKVDRVDTTSKFVRIIDYKTGSIDDSVLGYYTGRKLQLQLYMSAVKGDLIPAGVYYFPASISYSSKEDGRFRMKGFMNNSEEALLSGDNNISEKTKSEFFDAKLKGKSSNKIMDEDTFIYFLDYAVYEAFCGCQEMKKGFIAPTPYKDECRFCKYGGMCGFNYSCTPERDENSITTEEIANIAKRCKENKDIDISKIIDPKKDVEEKE